ncbi:MAG: type II secretion system protein GspG [candidate division WOR-3 bacterium]|nr:MAG: type II secretion system protein GspG [candidate division WOR-3 bacterium]
MKVIKPRGMALISIIIALLIAAILAFFAVTYYTGRGQEEAGPVTAPIDRAKVLQCQSQVRKIETAVQMYYAENVTYPTGLRELEGLSETDLYCPVTNSPYDYNPSTGRVTCPGH